MSVFFGGTLRSSSHRSSTIRLGQIRSFRSSYVSDNENTNKRLNEKAFSPSTSSSSSTSHLEKQERDNVVAQIRNALRQKRIELEPALKKKLEDLGKRWNEYSGYEQVEEAKAQTIEAEIYLKTLRDEQTTLRSKYMEAVNSRSSSQKILNDLLNRRASWSEEDISRYTQTLRDEHSQAKNEKEAEEKYVSIERKVNTAWDDVVKKTLERYHLEQVWSDRVRAGSTYGGLIVAGLNVLLFTLAFLVVEPYKRKKLAETFEARLLQGEEQNAAMLATVVQGFEERVGSMQEQGAGIDESIKLLLSRAGVETREGEVEGGKEDTITINSTPSQRSIKDRRKEMALAGGLGFAIGAGILAAMGALRS